MYSTSHKGKSAWKWLQVALCETAYGQGKAHSHIWTLIQHPLIIPMHSLDLLITVAAVFFFFNKGSFKGKLCSSDSFGLYEAVKDGGSR